MERLDHEITVEDAIAALNATEMPVASHAVAGVGVKQLVYKPGSQTWHVRLNGEEIASSYQPFRAVIAYSEAR